MLQKPQILLLLFSQSDKKYIWLQVSSEGGKNAALMFAPLKTCVLFWTTEADQVVPLCRNNRSPKGREEKDVLPANVFLSETLSHRYLGKNNTIRLLMHLQIRVSSNECMKNTKNVLRYPLGVTVLWTNRAGCLWGSDWAGRWSINYDKKASARLTPLASIHA